jgi:hypothetical protein
MEKLETSRCSDVYMESPKSERRSKKTDNNRRSERLL